MKKLIIFCLAAMIVLTACSQGTDENGGNNDGGDPLQGFRSFIAEAEEPTEVIEYMNELISNEADITTNDALILEYLNYMEEILNDYQAYPEAILESAGFKYISVEGSEVPIIDYRFIDAYYGKISQEMFEFSSFMSLNSEKYWAKDAAIVIPLEDLADRIAFGEQFMVKYPDSVMKDKVEQQYEYYLKSFLGGLDNTPLVLFDTNKVDPEFIAAFGYFLETYPGLITAEAVESFRSELAQTDYAAPYTYNDNEKRGAFRSHIDELVSNTLAKMDQ